MPDNRSTRILMKFTSVYNMILELFPLIIQAAYRMPLKIRAAWLYTLSLMHGSLTQFRASDRNNILYSNVIKLCSLHGCNAHQTVSCLKSNVRNCLVQMYYSNSYKNNLIKHVWVTSLLIGIIQSPDLQSSREKCSWLTGWSYGVYV